MDFKIKNTNLILNKAISQVWKVKKFSYENIARPDHGFLYLYSGKITYMFDNCRIELKAGDVIFLPKNSNYVVTFDQDNSSVEDYLINFDVIEGKEFASADKPTVILNDPMGTLLEYFKDVVNVYIEKDRPFLINSKFYLCLNYLQTALEYKNSDADRSVFEKAARRLVKNFDLTIEDVAKEMYISRSTFQKKFNQYFGMTPVEYRTEKRIQKAKLLLETTDMPIKVISDSLGFYDTSYFYKIFKKAYSITPKEYRETEKTVF